MNVTLVGGTGFVGGYLVDALLAAGHAVSLLVRSGSEQKALRRAECRLVAGSIDSPEAIAEAVTGSDAVIYNIGILREFPRQGITFENSQYRGVVRTAEAAQGAGVRRMLLMSANGVKSTGTAYQETKSRAEEAVKKSGLEYTIFRPSVIFGAPRGTLEIATQLYRDMIKPPLPAVGFHTGWSPTRGRILMSPVAATDVADAFVGALEDPATVGKTYSLGGPEVLSWTDMLLRVADAAGKSKTILPMPIFLMKVAATLFDWLPFFPVTRDQLTMLAEGNTADPAELQQLIKRDALPFSASNLSYLRPASERGEPT